MDINEKAKMYAEGKALDAITSAIEEAYANGYRDGYKDCFTKADIEPPIEIVEDGVEYIDLCLPSGKKWSFVYLYESDKYGRRSNKHFTYEEASKLNIPTKKDFLELIEHCEIITQKNSNNTTYKWDFQRKGNKNYIELLAASIKKASSFETYPSFLFWLRDDNSEGYERLCADGNNQNLLGKTDMGYELPIMLVK